MANTNNGGQLVSAAGGLLIKKIAFKKVMLIVLPFLLIFLLPMCGTFMQDNSNPPFSEEQINLFQKVGNESGVPMIYLMVFFAVNGEEKLNKNNLEKIANSFKYSETTKEYKEGKECKQDDSGNNICEKVSVDKKITKVYSLEERLQKEGVSEENIQNAIMLQQLWSTKLGVLSPIFGDPGDLIIGSNEWLWPTSSKRVTSKFGNRGKPCPTCTSFHPAIDIGAVKPGVEGDPVWSMADGTVIKVQYTSWGGNMVFVDHGGGVVTRYEHLQMYIVKEGQIVKKGQIIAYMGNTGDSTGAHLDFQIKINGNPVDPLRYFGL